MTGRAEMAQKGFVKELLRTYGHNGARSKLQGSRETMIHLDEEERALIDAEPVDTTGKEGVIEAQRRVGELLWLMGRTMPNLQHDKKGRRTNPRDPPLPVELCTQ